ncbi:hypothetical protein ABZW30_30005 [Kitasatospora sp. NPDC004669]|uniref:hypothetical protein n=1 Tax=Kitasatospora sp. NPDC004669 TaxID=3154555 RepID=UPI0033B928E1
MANLPIPIPYSWNVGDSFTAAIGNSTRDALSFLLNPPVFRGYQSTSQSVPANAVTPLAIDTVIVDSYGGHSTTVNTSRYTAQVPGWYLVIGGAGFGTSSTGARLVRIHKNGALIPASQFGVPNPSPDITTAVQSSALVYLAAGDYVEANGYQSSGAPLSTDNDTSLTVLWWHA